MKKIFDYSEILALIFSAVFLFVLLFAYFFFVFQNQAQKKLAKIPREKIFSDRGLYITLNTARSGAKFAEIRKKAKECGLNTLVIDVKEVLEKPLLELLKSKKLNSETQISPDPWFSQLTKELHQEGFIVTARIVAFKDDHLVLVRPDLGMQMKKGGLYRDNRGGRWADPYAREVRLYNELIAEAAAASGADEIQFDYIRFPAEGASAYIFCSHAAEGTSKVEIINSFLKSVKERLAQYNVSIAVDIFGVTAWQNSNDMQNLGQDLKQMAEYVDVISPMLYPSHFHDGYDGYANPGAEPYYFINTGVKKSKEIIGAESTVKITPWIQGFVMRSPNFGPNYILEQIKAAREAGSERFLIWNAGNVYDVSFEALKRYLVPNRAVVPGTN